ncbi:MAG: DUF433 domain-containing protein [Phycisphaerales bacterium]
MSALPNPEPPSSRMPLGFRPGRPAGELIPPDSVLAPFISVDPARVSGEPCFKGTRVPVKILFDHLRAGDPMSEFLEGFPPVTAEQATAVIDLASMGLLEGLRRL